MTDHLSHRQTEGLGTDRKELNAKFDAIARLFGIDWLETKGSNPLQTLWKKRDALATNELLNFGDAVEGFERLDTSWLKGQVTQITDGDEGNRAGAIFELLGLNLFLSAGAKVKPSPGAHPGFDATIELPDASSLLVSIKNHGMSTHETFFHDHAKELDQEFQAWLTANGMSGELRIGCKNHLDATAWAMLKQDIKAILGGHLGGTARDYQCKGDWQIVIKPIAEEFYPLSRNKSSSVVFLMAPAHKNEQDNFIENIRKGCANLVTKTAHYPDEACRVLFVRLCATASIKNCTDWAHDYFTEYPDEKVGLIILYQAAVVTSPEQTSLSHYILPIRGPQFQSWAHPHNALGRYLPNMSIMVGVMLTVPSAKVIQAEDTQIPLDNIYTYQRGDIYRAYKLVPGIKLEAHLSNPAPAIKIHAEIEENGVYSLMQMIASDRSRLILLP